MFAKSTFIVESREEPALLFGSELKAEGFRLFTRPSPSPRQRFDDSTLVSVPHQNPKNGQTIINRYGAERSPESAPCLGPIPLEVPHEVSD